MIICDTGPIVSAINRAERRRHLFAAELLTRLGREVIVPWPVLVEVDLLLRARGHAHAAITFAESLAAGVHRLETPTAREFSLSLKLAKRYPDSGIDIPDSDRHGDGINTPGKRAHLGLSALSLGGAETRSSLAAGCR